ncbi:hypothetical protein RCH09_000155 [Actimicrobium sp. GrIS 1.19]|nr:hypothetical protein [Actimicrobium sp. GrIS 1.19]
MACVGCVPTFTFSITYSFSFGFGFSFSEIKFRIYRHPGRGCPFLRKHGSEACSNTTRHASHCRTDSRHAALAPSFPATGAAERGRIPASGREFRRQQVARCLSEGTSIKGTFRLKIALAVLDNLVQYRRHSACAGIALIWSGGFSGFLRLAKEIELGPMGRAKKFASHVISRLNSLPNRYPARRRM